MLLLFLVSPRTRSEKKKKVKQKYNPPWLFIAMMFSLKNSFFYFLCTLSQAQLEVNFKSSYNLCWLFAHYFNSIFNMHYDS